jgi:hypothetical protein
MLAPRDRITGVLLGAADYIERHGWCQGTSRLPGGAVCAAWALTIAAGDDAVSQEAGRRLMCFVDSRGRNTSQWRVPYWNDQIGRTREQVVEALRSAAFAPA